MAIFHLSHSFLRRSRSSSSVATAAYISGKKLEDHSGSSEHSDYSRKGGVLFDEISLPAGSPSWANNRGELWRRLEAREDRSTRPTAALLAHKFNIALPHELTLEQNIYLARDFVREQFTRKGYPVDWAIHSADPRGDSRNIHLHILVPLRHIEGESFGIKARYTKSQLREQITAWRQSWASLTNRHLKRYGHTAMIDESSFKARGIKWIPTRHIGPLPKAKRYMLDSLRAKQPPQPIHGITRIVPDRPAAIASSSSKPETQPHATIATARQEGWPPQAIIDWEVWGRKFSVKFFIHWPELAPEGFRPSRGPKL